MSRRRPRRPREAPRSEPKSVTWPEEFRGICTTEKVTCALCLRVIRWNEPHPNAHRARIHARADGWTYLAPFGWVCGCRTLYPGVMELERDLRKATARGSGPQRLQVTLKLD